jgi:hypothetical protein
VPMLQCGFVRSNFALAMILVSLPVSRGAPVASSLGRIAVARRYRPSLDRVVR